ncbi:MAG TPA: NAD(P)/FAD-dependent oxidoreductase [Roseiflexaceae bacterium]|nr:NAD(P)/FAD-dependent oxidoreductase [Roseiflexaceae bacterium]
MISYEENSTTTDKPQEGQQVRIAAEEIAPPQGVQQGVPILARTTGRARVVVVGAGFGGLSVARTLAGQDVDVLILDRNNYHGFWPLLYQVATAGLEPEAIASPVRAIVRRYPNVNFLMAEVHGVDFDRKVVQTKDGGEISYDYLILSAGSANNYFGNNALADQTFGMKDIDEAEHLRNKVLSCFERAVRESDPEKRRKLLTIAVVGGGPTGVELAGAFAELIRHVLRKDYPMLDVSQASVVLIEATQKILATFPENLQKSAVRRLHNLGVEVRLGAAVDSVEHGEIAFKDGSHLSAATVIWAAGVRGASLADALSVKLARGARVPVTPTLNLAEHPEVYAIGDMAYLEGFKPGVAYPMVAPVANQMGEQAAKNILALIQKRPPQPFRYFDKGQMATIGRRAAVLDAFGIRMSGVLAWMGWLFIHIMELVGFRNRVIVLTNWAWNYFTYDRGVRLITAPAPEPEETPKRVGAGD